MSEWISQHPVLWAVIGVGIFLLWRLPEWFGQVWPLFTNKTVPEWLAERRWPGMSTRLYRWFNIITTCVMFVLLGVIIYQQQSENLEGEPTTASSLVAPSAPSTPQAPSVVEMTRRRQTDQKFSSLLQDFPANNSTSPLSQIVVNYKRVALRANTSSYTQAKVFGQWFKEAKWEVVEISDTLTEKFPSGITIRAPYNSGDAENVHTALCKLGYRVHRRLPDTSLTVGVASPPLDSIILEIGSLSR
jgi:hypothetical protein